MKKCKKCERDLPFTRFYIVRRKGSINYFNTRCKDCLSTNNTGRHKERIKVVDVEKVHIDTRQIYLLLKRIEMNNLQASYLDGLKIINEYIKIYGSDIKDYYNESEQLDIMYSKLLKYINM